MVNQFFHCRQCQRDTCKSLSNRCQYCGAALPEHMKMSEEEKEEFRNAQVRQKEEASEFASGMSDEPQFVREEKRKQAEGLKKYSGLSAGLITTIGSPGNS